MHGNMAQDLAHKRPYLFGSLIAGISFPATWLFLPIDGGLYAILWKMAAVGLLVPFALRRHHEGEFILLAIMLGFYTLGDGLIELSMVAGALAFAVGHLVAMLIYFRHRRVGPVFSQKLLAATIFFATPIIAYVLPPTPDEGIQVAAIASSLPPWQPWHGTAIFRATASVLVRYCLLFPTCLSSRNSDRWQDQL